MTAANGLRGPLLRSEPSSALRELRIATPLLHRHGQTCDGPVGENAHYCEAEARLASASVVLIVAEPAPQKTS